MKLKQLLEQLNQLSKEKPEALETRVKIREDNITILFETEDCKWIQNKIIEEEKLKSRNMEMYLRDVAELNITVRAYNALRNDGILTIGHLVATSEYQIIKIANLGKKSLAEIKKALNEINLSLGIRLPNNLMYSLGIERTFDCKTWDGKDSWYIRKINN